MKEEYSRNPSPKLLKDIQEVKKHIPQLQGQILKASGASQVKPIPPALTTFLHVPAYWKEELGTVINQQHLGSII